MILEINGDYTFNAGHDAVISCFTQQGALSIVVAAEADVRAILRGAGDGARVAAVGTDRRRTSVQGVTPPVLDLIKPVPSVRQR